MKNFKLLALLLAGITFMPNLLFASEADLVLPDLGKTIFYGISGHNLLLWGLIVCAFGFLFGLIQFRQLLQIKIHNSMKEISEIIYETCKTYLITQGKFIIILEILVGIIIVAYFWWLRDFSVFNTALIIACSIIGILGSYTVAWFGMRINTLANSRSAFVSLKGKPYPVSAIPLKAGMSIGMLLISLELFVMLCILLFIDPRYAGPCFIGFAIGESLGASVLRIAGGIFTKIADIGSDLMKIVYNIKEDDARNPGVIADCVGDNAGDSVGPTADGFETYGVTGVALISFIILAVHDPKMQAILLIWIFVMRLVMIIASSLSYWINEGISRIRYNKNIDKMNFETPLTTLVWITSLVSISLTFLVSFMLIGNLENNLWIKLASIISCGTIAGAIIPEFVKIFTSTESKHVKHVVNSSRKGGASLNILAGLTVGNFSAYWMGMLFILLMGSAYLISLHGLAALMLAPSVFAFGLVAFGFLGMGPVTIAVDSYGPVADNAQSIYELSLIETLPNIKEEIKRDFGFTPDFEKGKHYLECNDGAGNTFKATAKPVLIGTAVVGATTMIFSIIVILTNGLTTNLSQLSILYPPFLFGIIAGGAMVYWFSGASMHAVTSGSYYAVEFIKNNIKLDGVTKASTEDSKKVVEICTKFAQKGMINIFLAVFFTTLSFACINSYFFIGYLISIAIFGLFQAIFMANAGGAWDNAKKIVEVDLKEKGTELHAATVIGDTVGDPFKDTSSVALNPVIKFTTLFGLLAIELALELDKATSTTIAIIFFILALIFILKSFFDMRVKD
ncbi:MAG: sodium-translocating pyrophosphatase [Candidatus Margulisiibacteriota bacterium]|jgi:K(+)-stimulated pyrophosphate-energized sodium pump